jgi:hypothetical protein
LYPDEWRADLRGLANSEPDVVSVLPEMRERHPSFGREPFRIMAALRDEFGPLWARRGARDPVGTRAGGATSDLLVDGERWDVYTPQTKNPNRIISAVASKGGQVLGGGVIDLSESEVTADQLGNVAARIAGTSARVGKIVVIP